MITFRLQRAQLDIQSHWKWLQRFTGVSLLPSKIYVRKFTETSSFGNTQQANVEKASRGRSRTQWRKKQKQNQRQLQHVTLEGFSRREELREAVHNYDIKNVISIYNAIPDKKPLTSGETRMLAQCVHQSMRREIQKPNPTPQQEDSAEIVSFAIELVKDIRKGNLLPDVQAHVHLLAVFKESDTRDAGMKFWQWLESQDDDHVNLDVYAVALDIFAITGVPLQDMEEFYRNALVRFPGTFFAYHLSPTAIVPDREQPTSIKGLPISLLQSIAFARLVRGDSRSAYLALDTAMRLYPATINPRFLALFQEERPVSEYYTVFAMACRAGIQVPNNHFKGLLAQLRLSSDHSSFSTHIATIRAMLATIYLRISGSGSLSGNSVNDIVIAITQVLRISSVSSMEPEQRRKAVDSVLALIRKAMEVFARYGALPTLSSVNSIISNVAGHGRASDVVTTALADMERLQLQPDEITRRSILIAAGLNEEWDAILQAWNAIVAARDGEGKHPERLDVITFAQAAKRAGMEEAARIEFEALRSKAHPREYDSFEHHLTRQLQSAVREGGAEIAKAEELLEGIDKIYKDLAFFEKHALNRPVVHDPNEQPLPISLISRDAVLMPVEAEMRRLYDEFTTEQSPLRPLLPEHNAEEIALPSLSSTNIPLGTIRYENWKDINYLLWLAEKHDLEYERTVDQAIASGTSPPKRNMGLTRQDLQSMTHFGLSKVANRNSRRSDVDDKTVRKEILRLRLSKVEA